MNDLLAFAVAAHGGLDRWNGFTSLTAEVSITGAIWDLKQQPGLLTDKVFALKTREQQVTITPFTAPDRRCVFAAGRLTLETLDGAVVEARADPEAPFAGQTLATPWDALQVAYFASEAVWAYLTSPFLYTDPGFVTKEIAPWHEDGEEWRRLRIVFPDGIASHTREQVTHFGPDGLMRRHDYTVDILGGNTGANYPTGYRSVQGIMMPTARRIYAYDATGHKVPEALLVALDFGNMIFR